MALDVKNNPVEITINDVTLREGDQAPLTSFTKEEKMIIALMLQELGIKNIEVGFAASRADFDNIQGVLKIVDKTGPIIATLGRANEGDTRASLEVIKGYKNARIHIFLATSDEHIEAKFSTRGNTMQEKREWLLEQVKNEVGRAQEYKITHNSSLEIEFSPEDATGNALTIGEDGKKYLNFSSEQFDFLVRVCEEAIRSGATIINAPDTLGNLLPQQTELFFHELSQRLQFLRKEGYIFELSAHIHNDLGLASANAISAIRGGATQIEVTLNGIGERAGNSALHEIIGIIGEKGHAILDDGRNVIFSPKIRTELVGPVSEFVRKILNLNRSLQTPFIGPLSDVDGSGVHNAAQDVYGGTKNKAKYGGASVPEFFSPRGGANQIIQMLARLGIQEQKENPNIAILTTNACKKAETVKALYERNIFSLYQTQIGNFSITDIRISGNSVEVRIMVGEREILISGSGNGENGIIDGLISGINTFLGDTAVEVDDIGIVNKPSLQESYEDFLFGISQMNISVSENFRKKVQDILENRENKDVGSKQVGIAHAKLKIKGTEISSISSGNDINTAMIHAIIEGVLPEIIAKIDTK